MAFSACLRGSIVEGGRNMPGIKLWRSGDSPSIVFAQP